MQKSFLFLVLAFMLMDGNCLGRLASAQEYEGCWMVNSTGAIIDLNGSVCPRSPSLSSFTPLVFSNLKVEPTANGGVAVSGSVTNRNSQPIPLVLVEYKLVDQQSQEVLYKGVVPIATSGKLQAGESLNFSRILNANRLPQTPFNRMEVKVERYL